MHKTLTFRKKPIIGNKAEGLIYLDSVNLTPDFIVLAYDFLKSLNQCDDNKNKECKRIINDSLKQFKDKVILRSSSCSEDGKKQSFAGAYKSVVCEKKDILKYISKILNSYNDNPYPNKNSKKVKFGIIIQQYIKHDYSGVTFAFTEKNKMFYTEFSKGHNAVVSGGKISGYNLRYDNIDFWGNDYDDNLKERLAAYLCVLNNITEEDNDFEFALTNKRIQILQKRPITAKINVFVRAYLLFPGKEYSTDSIADMQSWIKYIFSLFKVSPHMIFKKQKNIFCTGDGIKRMMNFTRKISDEAIDDFISKLKQFHDKAYTKTNDKITLHKLGLVITILNRVKKVCEDKIILYYGGNKNKSRNKNVLTKPKIEKRLECLSKCQKIIELYENSVHKFLNIKQNKAPTAHKNKKQFDKVDIKNIFLKGVSVYPGAVSGKIRLIKRESDIRSVKPGEIILAYHLHYNLIPRMHSASGIITEAEHAGLLSHAAIIARELKIPCIIDCEGCTGLLKTGDYVKIQNGEVKLINDTADKKYHLV